MALITITRKQLEEATSAHYDVEYSDWHRVDPRRKEQLFEQMEVAFGAVHIEVRDDR